jgi:energy-converting hydrogenase A subunit C
MANELYISIIGIIIILMALRSLVTNNRVEKLLYLNVVDFGITAVIALYAQSMFGFIVAATFFITSTLSSNAIAYSLKKLDNEIILDNEDG